MAPDRRPTGNPDPFLADFTLATASPPIELGLRPAGNQEDPDDHPTRNLVNRTPTPTTIINCVVVRDQRPTEKAGQIRLFDYRHQNTSGYLVDLTIPVPHPACTQNPSHSTPAKRPSPQPATAMGIPISDLQPRRHLGMGLQKYDDRVDDSPCIVNYRHRQGESYLDAAATTAPSPATCDFRCDTTNPGDIEATRTRPVIINEWLVRNN